MYHIHKHKGFTFVWTKENCGDVRFPLGPLHHLLSRNIYQLTSLFYSVCTFVEYLNTAFGSERSYMESFILGQLKSKLALSILWDFYEPFFRENAWFGRDWVCEGIFVLHSADKPACYISSPCHFPNSIPRMFLSMTTNKMEIWHVPLTSAVSSHWAMGFHIAS